MNSMVDGRSQRAGEVGHEHRGALEHADEQRLATVVVGVDPRGQLGDLGLDLVGARSALPRCRRPARTRRLLLSDRVRLAATGCQIAGRHSHRRVARCGPWPCQSVTSASSAADVVGGERAGPARRSPSARSTRGPDRPGAARCDAIDRQRPRRLTSSSPAWASSASRSSRQLAGRAGQRLGDAALQHVLEQGQHLGAQPDPLVGRIVVVRVVPDRQAERVAGRLRGRPPDAEQRPQARPVRPARMPAIDRGPEPRPRPSSTVSAWSSRVWPSRTSTPRRRGDERRVAGRAGRRLRATGRRRPRPGSAGPGRSPARSRASATRAAWSADPGCRP